MLQIKHTRLQQNISSFNPQFGSGFFLQGTVKLQRHEGNKNSCAYRMQQAFACWSPTAAPHKVAAECQFAHPSPFSVQEHRMPYAGHAACQQQSPKQLLYPPQYGMQQPPGAWHMSPLQMTPCTAAPFMSAQTKLFSQSSLPQSGGRMRAANAHGCSCASNMYCDGPSSAIVAAFICLHF
jgi:hypothetical protein